MLRNSSLRLCSLAARAVQPLQRGFAAESGPLKRTPLYDYHVAHGGKMVRARVALTPAVSALRVPSCFLTHLVRCRSRAGSCRSSTRRPSWSPPNSAAQSRSCSTSPICAASRCGYALCRRSAVRRGTRPCPGRMQFAAGGWAELFRSGAYLSMARRRCSKPVSPRVIPHSGLL